MKRAAALTASLVVLSVLLLASAALARPVLRPAGAPGAVQQDGEKPAFALDHVLVGLTVDAYRRSALVDVKELGEAAPGAATGLASLDALAREAGVTRVARGHRPCDDTALAAHLGLDRVFRFDVPEGTDILALAALLQSDSDVEYAVPDRRAELAYVPNDFSYPANWGHDNTMQLAPYDSTTWGHTGSPLVGLPGFDADADMAWDLPTMFGNSGVIIAILDTGVDPIHGDLLQVGGYDFGDSDWNPADDIPGVAGHGTCCAGVAAAIPDNSYIAAGVAGGCSIMPLKVGDTAGNLWSSYVANALTFAANNGASVASMSFGFPVGSYPVMDSALAYADSAGVVLLAAAGNDNTGTLEYPANSQWVISVGAASPCGERKRSSNLPGVVDPGVTPDPNGVTCDDEYWWGSNYGNASQDSPGALDVLAPTILPTTDITGAAGYWPGDFEPWFNGTSCATPYAAGVCALIRSANPNLTPAEVRTILVNACTDVTGVESAPGWDMYSGYGLVNAQFAVQNALVPVANFMASTTGGCMPLMVQFTDLSGGFITSWQWDFGDGGQDFVPNPVWVYNQPGTYTVSLTVTGLSGQDTFTWPDLVTVDGPSVSDFTATLTHGYAPLTTTFQDASLNTPTFWDWDFGDGQQSNAQNPPHTYNDPGLYPVQLVTNNACGGDVMFKDAFIEVCDTLDASFVAGPTSGADTLTVVFTDQSDGAPTLWSWDFGDGDSSEEPNPTHFYEDPGRYTVRLIVGNACEADTVTVADMVVLATTTAAEEAPHRFALAGNSPNPFNPATTIDFSLERAGRARLEIFDAAGRLVEVLVDGELPAGSHEVDWRPERSPSGVYLARLSAHGRTALRRLVLLK